MLHIGGAEIIVTTAPTPDQHQESLCQAGQRLMQIQITAWVQCVGHAVQ